MTFFSHTVLCLSAILFYLKQSMTEKYYKEEKRSPSLWCIIMTYDVLLWFEYVTKEAQQFLD